jgi:hypothetical protein
MYLCKFIGKPNPKFQPFERPVPQAKNLATSSSKVFMCYGSANSYSCGIKPTHGENPTTQIKELHGICSVLKCIMSSLPSKKRRVHGIPFEDFKAL